MKELNGEFNIGDKVRVKPEIKNPAARFGEVTHKDIGIVRGLVKSGRFKGSLLVDFEGIQVNWKGYSSEMELVEAINPIKPVKYPEVLYYISSLLEALDKKEEILICLKK